MKKIIFLLSLCCICLQTIAQTLEIGFDSTSQYIKIDTTAGNIWQIGNPDKCFFGNYPNDEKAMITDSVNYYPSNNYSSFILNLPFFISEFYGICLNVTYSLDSDTLKDGGYVEYAFDSDTNWTNVYYSPLWGGNDFTDTITGGTPAITGQRQLWGLSACSCFLGTGYPKYRFVFKSDSIDNQRCGWSIFHITASVFYCDGIEEINSVGHFANVYPNPVADISFLHINDQNQEIEHIQFFNSIGVLMKTISDPGQNEIPVLKKDFSAGLFFYRVQLKDGTMDAGKFVVN